MEKVAFVLYDSNGKFIKVTWATNFRKAREAFAVYHSGKYRIEWNDKDGIENKKNVRL